MLVTEIQRFCMHDGPGLRTTVFLKGCPLRCEWCHNPETQIAEPQLLFDRKKCIYCLACEACPTGAHSFEVWHIINRSKCLTCGKCADLCPTGALQLCGREYASDEILKVIKKDAAFYGEKGGVTVSGGEPFVWANEVIKLLGACKECGINTAAETCGYFPSDIIKDIVPVTDLFLWDIKLTDSEMHKKFTGVSNEKILQNLFTADKMGAKILLRCILISDINTNTEHYDAVAEIASRLEHCEGVEFIPYHAYAGSKYLLLGQNDTSSADLIPSDAEINAAIEYLSDKGIYAF